MIDRPVLFSLLFLVLMWLSVQLGAYLRRKQPELDADRREELNLILGGSLTLLGLIIGFTFSMAVSRYDQRKNYEEEEANAIGTEYVRADFLPADDATKAKDLLKKYLDQRILFYSTRDQDALTQINARTAQLQDAMWSSVRTAAAAQPSPVIALTVAGMNDVINRQGYTQAAWWNRIPGAAWALMGTIAIGSSTLLGFTTRMRLTNIRFLFVLPLMIAIAFFLIADIDSPRSGVIEVRPQNLISLAESLNH